MTQNLRLVGPVTLTSSNTNLSSVTSFELPASAGGVWRANTPPLESEVNAKRVYYANDTTNGAYYNWYTATAGVGQYATAGEVSDSICPKNWRLPNANTDWRNVTGSYGNLWYGTYGIFSLNDKSPELLTEPLSFALAGFYPWNTLANSNFGYYVTNTAASDDTGKIYVATFVLVADLAPKLGLNAYDKYEKSTGMSVRCLVSD